MLNKMLLLAGLWPMLFAVRLSAQSIPNYAFTTSAGTFTALSGAVSPALTTGNTDNGTFTALPVGFDFWYMGARYTTVSASTNGWLALGSTITDDSTNGLSARGTRPLIAPLWDDLDIVAASNFTYLTSGTVGSRVLKIQYLNVKWGHSASGAVSSFQVNLYEATGKVEFVYQSQAIAPNIPTASIGIAAAATGSGNFLSVNNAGTTVSSTTEASVTTKPVSGKTYDFTPPVPTAPSGLTFSAVTASSMTLNWTDNSSNETGFAVYRSTDGSNYTFVSQTAANTVVSAQSGLAASTTYYWKVYAVTEGALSTALSSTHATSCSPPAAPTVSTPVTYCQNATATQLTATGSNLVWGSGAVSGSVGGTTALTSTVYADNSYNNRKTIFTTTAANTTITTVDYYVPSYQSTTGIVLAIFNSAGAIVATSSTTSSVSAGATAFKVTNTFNYIIAAAGSYSIGLSAGTGNLGYDNPSFPITESSGTINITGTSPSGYRCFTNIQFTVNNGSVAPTPSTTTAGTTNYLVSQTISGCTSPQATIAVIVTAAPSAVISYATPYCKSLASQAVTITGTGGGTYSAASGLTLNAATGAITPSSSTAGAYTVTYTVAAAGGCALYTTTTPVTITSAPAVTISYSGSPYCASTGTAAITFSGTSGGTYSAPAGLVLNPATGLVNVSASTAGTYTVTDSIAASGGCSVYKATASITITASPAISNLSTTNLIAYYKFSGNANDATNNDSGTLQNAPVLTTDRFGVANSAYTMNGTSNYISTANQYVNPTNFTISIWFKTATVTGGKLIGFGAAQTGLNYQFDRQIYMSNTGQLYFGIYSSGVITVNSALSYNDNSWHLATATLSSTTGMSLYVDGALIGSNTSATAAESYTGYWRIGYDNMVGWTAAPSSQYFSGVLDDALIYHRALSASEVATAFASPDGAGNNGPVCTGSSISLSGTTVSGATYAWTGPNGFTATTANPAFIYSSAALGSYRLIVTGGGCTSTAYTNVVSSSTAGQWTGSVSTDWSNGGNWCSGNLPTAATNVVIAAGATFMPVITTSVSCNNLTINTGATMTTSVTGTLNIAGAFTNNGTVTNGGTTNFNGSAGQQTFSGITQFYNLTISNAVGLLLPVTIIVNNNLTISSGTLVGNDFNISIQGNWINNASATAFSAGSGRLTVNGTAAQSIGGSFSTTFNNLTITDTISTTTLLINTVVSGSLTVAAGIFDLSTFTANRASAGGVLLVSNNATLKIGGTNTFPANYATNTLVVAGTVQYSGANQNVSSQVYGNLKLSSSGGAAIKTMPATALTVTGNLSSTLAAGTSVSFTAAAPITVNGNVTIGASTTFNGGSYSHSIGGNWSDSGVFAGNSGTIIFTGTGSSVGGPGTQNFNNLTVAASAVSFSSVAIALSGNLSTTGSGSFSQVSGGSLTMTGSGTTIAGTGISLNDLTISGSVTTAIALTLTGNLAVSGSFTASSGVLTMSGAAKTITGSGTIGFYSLSPTGTITTAAGFSIASSLAVSGAFTATAGTATFTGTSSVNGLANLYNTTINGTSLQLTANATLGIAGLLTITAGSLDVTSSTPNTVNFNSAAAQNINGLTYNNLTLSNGNTKTAAAAITANNNITIAAGTTFTGGAFTHTCYNDWINNGVFTAGSGTVQFMGATTSDIFGPTTFNTLTIANASNTAQVVLHSNISAATVNMTTGNMNTGPDTLTITGTRTGNGIILGAIRRTNSFATGVAYAFESPYNTITFASLSGVTSVTVYVADESILDFPFGASIRREYDISVPAGTYTTTLRLHYTDDELNGVNESTMSLWNYNGTTWNVLGKTANDTSLNYVEQSGITALSTRWTLSSSINVVQWNGSVSTDWNTAANWTVLQGSASTPPASTDVVNLGTIAFTYHPTISTPVSVKNIVFGSAQALNLSFAAGGSLTTGDIHGLWTGNATHNINANGQALTINGDLGLSDGIAGHAINLTIGSGTVSTSGSLIESGNANITFTGPGVLDIYQDFSYSSGVFTGGSGTVVYNGTINQAVGAVAYNNLTISKPSAIANMGNPVTLSGNLLISAGELDNSSIATVAGNMTLSSGATFINYDTLHIKGNWINNGTYSGTGGSTYFDGTGPQSISASTFNNIFINKPVGSTAQLTGNLILKGNLNVISGTLDLQTYSFSRTILGGAITSGDSATVIIGGNTPPANFTTYTFSPSSNTIFNGMAAQVLYLPGAVFGNLIFRNAGAKSLNSPITVGGNLTIESGSNFDAGSQTLTLNGNWLNNGTFTPSASTLLLNGISKTITGNTSFNKVTITGSYVQASNITYNAILTITPTGAISSGGGIFTIVNGDLLNQGILNTSGTATFSGTQLQTLSLINASTFVQTVNFNGSVSPVLNSTTVPQFGILNINNTGGVSPSVGWSILSTFTVGSGASFNGGPSTHNMSGPVTNNGTITSSGTMNFIPTAAAVVNLGSNFSSTGRVVFGGAGAMTLAGSATAFNNVLISNTNAAGISPVSGWTIANTFTINAGALFNAGAYTYSVGNNIANSGTLNSGSSTFILNGSGDQDLSSASPFNNLTVNKPAGAGNLLTNIIVTGILNFVAGNIRTNSAGMVVTATGSAAGAAQNTGWVVGLLKKNITTGAAVQTYEIGDSTNYTPVSMAFSNVSAAGAITASTTPGDHPAIGSSAINPAKSVNRYWTLTNNGVIFDKYAATFNFRTADVDAGANTAAFQVGLYNGSSWLLPAVAAPSATHIQATGLTAVGDFAIGQVCNANTTISYAGSPYCSNTNTGSATLVGSGGGIFNSAAGLTIDSSTGIVHPGTSVAGAYIVQYSVAASGGCPVYATSASVTIVAAPVATIIYAGSPYCSGAGTAPVTLTGTTGGLFSAAAGLSINDTTGAVTLGASSSGTYSVRYTLTGCAPDTAIASFTITPAGTWLGISADWNTGTNWSCGAIPVSTTDVTIPAGVPLYPLISSGTAPVHNITIGTGAALTVSGGTLQIAGAISNSGVFTASSGAIVMNGSAPQTIPAAAFAGNLINNFTINNSAGVSLQGPLNCTGILLAAAGNLNAGGYLTLVSTATQTASVDGSGTGEVTGNVIMQRYLPYDFGYKYVSSPFTADTVGDYAGNLNLTATFPTFYRYDESLASNGFVTYTAPSGQLTPMQGYAADLGSSGGAITIKVTGVLNNHTLSTPSLYNHNMPYTLGFNLVGNPYPSPVNWNSTTGWTKTNIDNALYYFNAGVTDQYSGVYSTYINGISSDGIAGSIIPAMQGFLVHVSDGAYPVTGQLMVNNNARVLNPGIAFFGIPEQQAPMPLVRLSAGFASETLASDPAVFYFPATATRLFDRQLDALKLLNTDAGIPSLFSVSSDSQKISINALPAPYDSLSIPLGLITKKAGWITFNAKDIQDIPDSRNVYLYDVATGMSHDLKTDPLYRLYLAAGDYSNRFFLKFSTTRTVASAPVTAESWKVYSSGGQLFVNAGLAPGEEANLLVTNILGQVITRQVLTGNTFSQIRAYYAPGIYLVSLSTAKNVQVKKIFITSR